MNVPEYLAYFPEFRLLTWTPLGVLDQADVKEIVSFIEWQESNVTPEFNRFIDTTRLDAINLNFSFVFDVALRRRLTFSTHPEARSAVLVKSKRSAHYFELHKLLTDCSPLQVKIFDRRSAVARWLGVPLDVIDQQRERSPIK